MSVPNEVIALYGKARCPICKGSLSYDKMEYFKIIGPDGHGDPNPWYTAVSWCETDAEEYELKVDWQDPKSLSKSEESMTFYDEKKQYTIKASYLDEEVIWTQLTIIPLDECGSPDEEGKKYDRLLDGKYFDFSKFDIDRYINRIKTIVVFE